ncbi:MAG: ATP-binding protein [Gammaproteobacteria bacterium]|nr:ATP-binding protein [Gammaproteobacteria bacterium]MXW44958.1 ATP-binding protein [Gammaproteobacteria bacterium]MYD02560.1 ATP-binding protein [Gammaproteobacteria bacterium]MYI25325.1 ATP-binding protein [Gammaproteobacteria bacterium]
MIYRPIWLEKIRHGWTRRPVVWLSGVRRAGKTTLARMLPGSVYMNCDLPSVARTLEDPELFLAGQPPGSVIVFDEVHRLPDPSRLLKIAADEYPQLKILATGSSTLAATGKFRDSLTGRKAPVHLCPVLWEECGDHFGIRDLDRRLLHGGLPESLLAERKSPALFAEWIDSFFARDILELFSIRNRQGFLSLFRLLLRWSGGQMDYNRLARSAELSRPTVKSYLEALEVAHAAHILRPFRGGGSGEIVSRPKCYAFDTGFVTHEKGWSRIRKDDRGLLWEHLVLDALRLRFPSENIFYWRDKAGREVDFVVRGSENHLDAFECKINPGELKPDGASEFRRRYPRGRNYVITPLCPNPYAMRRGGLEFTVCGISNLAPSEAE